MKKEIKFSLVYRDMWQSSGKYQPRVDQLVRIAPLIIEMGCFARVETNGGAFEQVNLLYGENPNKAVRAFTQPFKDAGIQTHMLDRGLNALRMYPVPADVRRLMYKVKHAQGVDITRIFCGLNETRNIIPSIRYALEAGMIPQACFDPDIAILLWQARKSSMTLKGADCKQLILPIPFREIQKAIQFSLPGLISNVKGDERNVLLTLSRMWFTLETEDVTTKDVAAEWVIPQLPETFTSLL